MIYTITVNPSLDYVLSLENWEEGQINRTTNYRYLAGGKGINVSQMLNELHVDNTVWGFVGGFTGKEIVRQLNRKHIVNDMVTISDTSRINIKMNTGRTKNAETEINTAGPKINEQEIAAFKARFSDLQPGDLVVMSGSLAANLPVTFYQDLLPLVKNAGAEFVVDTTGVSLTSTLEYQPFLIKPNKHELAEIFASDFSSEEEMLADAQKLQEMGAQNVMLSLGAKGGYLLTPEHIYFANSALGVVVNPVGAGDAMLAGFISQISQDKANAKEALRWAMACGGATAFTTDIAVKSQVDVALKQIQIKLIS